MLRKKYERNERVICKVLVIKLVGATDYYAIAPQIIGSVEHVWVQKLTGIYLSLENDLG